MSITREEVMKVADSLVHMRDQVGSMVALAEYFKQQVYELGRKDQRESDAKLFELDPSCDNFRWICEAIRNNTGELK